MDEKIKLTGYGILPIPHNWKETRNPELLYSVEF